MTIFDMGLGVHDDVVIEQDELLVTWCGIKVVIISTHLAANSNDTIILAL